MIYNRSLLTIAAFLSLGINGLTFTFLGTSLPVIRQYLDIGIDQAGHLMAMLQVGFTFFALVGGILSDSLRCERILMIGCLVLAVSSLLFCTFPKLGGNLIIALVMGSGLGCILSGSNSLLIQLYPSRKGAILNIHHVFFGLGSLIGPLLMGYLIAGGGGMRWRFGYLGEALLLFILAGVFFLTRGESPQLLSRSLLTKHMAKLVKDRQFRTILLVNSLTMGSQVALLLLGVTFLVETKEFSISLAGIALSLYSVAMIIGRLLCSRLVLRVRHATIIVTLLWMQVGSLFFAWYSTGWVAFCCIALGGLTISGIYPTSLALSGIFFPRVAGSALGLLSTVSGFGSIVICWLTAYVAGLTDMQMGFTVIVLACLSGLVLFQLSYRTLCKREGSPEFGTALHH